MTTAKHQPAACEASFESAAWRAHHTGHDRLRLMVQPLSPPVHPDPLADCTEEECQSGMHSCHTSAITLHHTTSLLHYCRMPTVTLSYSTSYHHQSVSAFTSFWHQHLTNINDHGTTKRCSFNILISSNETKTTHVRSWLGLHENSQANLSMYLAIRSSTHIRSQTYTIMATLRK